MENPERDQGQPVREKLAALCHEQWSGWMKYLFDKSSMDRQGNCVIPRNLYKRWYRQMNTEYGKLSKAEKDSDRTEADKFIELIKE